MSITSASLSSLALLEQVRKRLQRTLTADINPLPVGSGPAPAQVWQIGSGVQLLATLPGSGAASPVRPAGAGPTVEVYHYVSRNLGEQLRARGICYADAMGNAWVRHPALVVFVQGCSRLSAAQVRPVPVLQVNQMRLLFQLIMTPAIAGHALADLADFTQMPRTVVAPAVQQLRTYGLWLADAEQAPDRLPELARYWVAHYASRLRNRLNPQRYRWADPAAAAQLAAWPAALMWGGQAAAHRLLAKADEPDRLTLYSPLPRPKLVKALGLVPARSGAIELLNSFSPTAFHAPANPLCVAPLLVYADLVPPGATAAAETPFLPASAELAEQLRVNFLGHLIKD